LAKKRVLLANKIIIAEAFQNRLIISAENRIKTASSKNLLSIFDCFLLNDNIALKIISLFRLRLVDFKLKYLRNKKYKSISSITEAFAQQQTSLA
jgi:hypothetical protein